MTLLNRFKNSCAKLSRLRFVRDRRASVLPWVALASLPVLGIVGLAVDYSRASTGKAVLQNAVDAAALAIAQDSQSNPTSTATSRMAMALNVLTNNLDPATQTLVKALPTNTVFVTESGSGDYTVSVPQVNFPLSVSRVFTNVFAPSVTGINISASATATTTGTISSNKTVEIALALDNTGSMSADIGNLQTTATNMVNTVMSAGNGSNVKFSVVPYVATVNPGLSSVTNYWTMVDTTAVTPFNGAWFTWAWVAYEKSCVQNWGSGSGGTSSGPGGSSSGDAADASDLKDLLDPFRKIARELFGVSSAQAQTASPSSKTPNTANPFTTTSDKDTKTGRTMKVPTGFNFQQNTGVSTTGSCAWLVNPATVSHYDLFARTLQPSGSLVAWKGCVEARVGAGELAALGSTDTTDYDVTDTPPSASIANSLFTPYFWPDEPDWSFTTWTYVAPGAWSATSGGFHNNYLSDGDTHAMSGTGSDAAFWASWGWSPNNYWGEGQWILKYDSATKAAIINEQGPSETYGPNASCPDAVLRLSPTKSIVTNKIAGLTYWYNGGTIISEGLMWAWRSLSPQAPYADGAAYTNTNNQKIIVLMTDGINGLADNGNSSSPNISDYSAYGYLGGSRLAWYSQVKSTDPAVPSMPSDVTVPFGPGISTYDQVQTFFDVRLLKACTNAKAAGIQIYAVMFNHNGFLTTAQQAHSYSLLQQCANKVTMAYLATDVTSLNSAFAAIAKSVTGGGRVKLKL